MGEPMWESERQEGRVGTFKKVRETGHHNKEDEGWLQAMAMERVYVRGRRGWTELD
jgi:hypothetical protein